LPSDGADRDSGRTDATLAPRWHTAVLVALIVAVAITGTLLGLARADGEAPARPVLSPGSRILFAYLPLIFVNLGLVVYTTQLFREHNALPALLGRAFDTPRRAASDFALATACFIVICGLEFSFQTLAPLGHNAALARVLPSTGAERLTWVAVALCVGFSEEVVYRGYLRTQLAAFTRSPALGVALQAVLFGLAHLDRGAAFGVRAALYGTLFGLLAQARRSLWPGILCHVSLDLAGALLR